MEDLDDEEELLPDWKRTSRVPMGAAATLCWQSTAGLEAPKRVEPVDQWHRAEETWEEPWDVEPEVELEPEEGQEQEDIPDWKRRRSTEATFTPAPKKAGGADAAQRWMRQPKQAKSVWPGGGPKVQPTAKWNAMGSQQQQPKRKATTVGHPVQDNSVPGDQPLQPQSMDGRKSRKAPPFGTAAGPRTRRPRPMQPVLLPPPANPSVRAPLMVQAIEPRAAGHRPPAAAVHSSKAVAALLPSELSPGYVGTSSASSSQAAGRGRMAEGNGRPRAPWHAQKPGAGVSGASAPGSASLSTARRPRPLYTAVPVEQASAQASSSTPDVAEGLQIRRQAPETGLAGEPEPTTPEKDGGVGAMPGALADSVAAPRGSATASEPQAPGGTPSLADQKTAAQPAPTKLAAARLAAAFTAEPEEGAETAAADSSSPHLADDAGQPPTRSPAPASPAALPPIAEPTEAATPGRDREADDLRQLLPSHIVELLEAKKCELAIEAMAHRQGPSEGSPGEGDGGGTAAASPQLAADQKALAADQKEAEPTKVTVAGPPCGVIKSEPVLAAAPLGGTDSVGRVSAQAPTLSREVSGGPPEHPAFPKAREDWRHMSAWDLQVHLAGLSRR